MAEDAPRREALETEVTSSPGRGTPAKPGPVQNESSEKKPLATPPRRNNYFTAMLPSASTGEAKGSPRQVDLPPGETSQAPVMTPPRPIHFAPIVRQPLFTGAPLKPVASTLPDAVGRPFFSSEQPARTTGLKHSVAAADLSTIKRGPEPARQDAPRPQPAPRRRREKATPMDADRTGFPLAPISRLAAKQAPPPPVLVPPPPERQQSGLPPAAAEQRADARKNAGGGVRIGTVEVRVAPPVAAAAPVRQPRPAPVSRGALSQGFRTFGLTQS
jgi:hypothetical protein